MRNISKLAVSMVLLAAQANNPLVGAVAAAEAPSGNTAGVYEVKLNTTSTSAVIEFGSKKPDFDAEVLVPLKAAQAKAARKAAEAKAAAKRKTVRKTPVANLTAAAVPGTHADWMRAAGIAESDFGFVDYIISRESGWAPTKWNRAGSGAYGLGQALPATKMAKFGADYMTNPVTQLKWADTYAKSRYGSWANAYAHWMSRHVW